MQTLSKVKNIDFKDQTKKKFIEEQIPDINVAELFKVKKKEKKEDEL